MDQERPIEKLLRGAARDRREQAGDSWELHPATKRLLQGEVARCYSRKTAEAESAWSWSRLLPRVAWACGVSAVLALALWAVWPESPAGPSLAMDREPARERIPGQSVEAKSAKELERHSGSVGFQAGQTTATGNLGFGVSPSEPQVSKGITEIQPASPAPPAEHSGRLASPASREDLAGVTLKAKAEPPANRSFGTRLAGSARAVDETEAPNAKPTAAATHLEGVEIARKSLSDVTVSPESNRAREVTARRIDADTVRMAAKQPQVFYGYFQAVSMVGSQGVSGQKAAASAGVSVAEGRAKVASAPVRVATEESKAITGDFLAKDAVVKAGLASVPQRRVLQSFVVNQQGNEVLVVDDDGSVYKGPILDQEASPAPLATSQTGGFGTGGRGVIQPSMGGTLGSRSGYAIRGSVDKPVNGVQPQTESELSGNQSQVFLNFSVTGTNKTLSRKVTFAGKLLVANSNLVSNTVSNVPANVLKQVAKPALLYQNQVMGRATVEGLPAVDVNASQVPSSEEDKTGALPKLPDGP